MGTELLRVHVKEENEDIPSVPPGFESFGAFTLKRVHDVQKQESQNTTSYSATASSSESHAVQMDVDSDSCGTKSTRSLRRRSCINYGRLCNSSEDESDFGKPHQNHILRSHLPKGVIRGCANCSNCQKVTARWRPEHSCRPDLENAPVFYPTEEEFEHTLNYIAKIRPKAEPYGICRIVPPPSWKPPCPLKEKNKWEGSRFATRVQRVDKLQNRDSMRKMSGMYNQTKKKRRRCMRMASESRMDGGNIHGSSDAGGSEAETFGFEPGPEFSLKTFQKYADEFKAQYFSKNDNIVDKEGNMTDHNKSELSVENIEGEYWRIVEKATEEIEVLYGADLETGAFGSGFPKFPTQKGSITDERYQRSGWNLNNFPRLPGSVLSYEAGDISGVLVPWLYIGMCFSSFCWHVEDHHLYSLNYMHWGEPKLWYGVPGKDAIKLEEAMRKHLPDLFEEQPDLLHKLVTQLSPSVLKSEEVSVYRCVQNAGEFVLTFPRAYHSGFNCGFNCAEAVNVAPVDWLPHGQIAIELYREQGRRTSISHDKLLLGAAREAVKAHWELNLMKKTSLENLRWKEVCGRDGILANALKTRVEMERVRREFLCSSSLALKMHSNFDATRERECCICLFDLHLSAAACRCSPDKYACLNHAKQLCPCAWNAKYFLYRYDLGELNILVEALEGKLSAVYRWAKLDLGLALTSNVSTDPMQSNKLSYTLEGTTNKETRPQLLANSPQDLQGTGCSVDVTLASSGIAGETVSDEKTKFVEPVALKDLKSQSSPLVCPKVTNEDSSLLTSDLGKSHCEFSLKKSSSAEKVISHKGSVKSPLTLDDANVILLSDDEDDDSKKPSLEMEKGNSVRPPDVSATLSNSVDTPCNDNKESVLTETTVTKIDFNSFPNAEANLRLSDSLKVKVECLENSGTVMESHPSDSSHTGRGPIKGGLGRSVTDLSTRRVTGDDHCVANADNRHSQPSGSRKPDDEDKVGANSTSHSIDNSKTVMGSPSCLQNNLDRYYRQKGPRIAKVVRRINCNVEPLDYGVVLSGKSWCNSHAIFPKGFKSRVRYINVLDPTNTCFYVSEILDAGWSGPLFMVSLEHCPCELFIHVSAARCWEMVRDRVNQEITKQHKFGKSNLPPLQPPGSLDGLEMFGFSSPAIVQVIEALDQNRVCTDYWDSRPYSRPQGQIPLQSQFKGNGGFSQGTANEQNRREAGCQVLQDGLDVTLRSLLKKASQEELLSLRHILSDNGSKTGQVLITQLLDEEIHTRPR
ncbi:hypothetical protein K2173_015047 [Erythroxylum novogranatense]|uniref:Lysine-specific demethylase JMJ16 n=1 Tax=Erythroxylum novogranatense TaxID=1862640 RepID=A0AAV8T292_9ROSI|nr:hypothetical protein K2173_015047 [Erythroxylum novogranatense]